MVTTTLKVSGMHCASCGLLIDDTLEDLPGVQKAQTDSRRERTVVWFDPSSTPLGDILQTITDLGYTAQEIGS